MKPSWSDAPLVFVQKPTCPLCGSVDYQRIRTEDNGDGSTTKKVKCRSCDARFKIVYELLPETGNAWLDTE